ncbi:MULTISPECIES: phage head closure protein [Acinetobacter]|uniref:phage head closure protein n=1 Tax=Acinetobacter TaxID=469 RepID=UPI0013BC8962|nr:MULTISPECIES: phage head closure protein [Acinetobacter]MCG6614561.1 phage head closure protein [Acinetobacter baumannii]MCO9048474.1 phage head closure protein [Acinetobacter sp. UC24323]MCW6486272.1 phage head closure protein [Acinetobacter baumannii]MDC5022043.1 phage head closure protein [Acinetobacter baumannii]NDX29570.1 phage head closure protein [Acinetobacter baumannii]
MPSITPKLKHRITIQKAIQTQDQNTGKLITSWSNFATIWAEVTDLSTRDVIAAKAANSAIQARAKVRYSSTTKQIDSTMRVLFDGYFYKIDGNPMRDPDSRREYLTINLSTGEKAWNG